MNTSLAQVLALWQLVRGHERRFYQVLQAHGTVEASLEQLQCQARSQGQHAAVNWHQVGRQLSWSEGGVARSILTWQDDAYPPQLRAIPYAPPLLFCEGDITLLRQPQIAIVGGRKASELGQDIAFVFAKQLVARGWVVSSGLARGIDAAAHRGALAGGGKTVAVLGCGLDCSYPRQHRLLQRECVEHGLVLSMFPIGTGPRKHHFPQRNRVVSGLSVGVLVVEASLRSGALITAKHALDQGREVMAVPHGIDKLSGLGGVALLQQGAYCVITPEDVASFCGQTTLDVGCQSNKVGGMPPQINNNKRWAAVWSVLTYELCSLAELTMRHGSDTATMVVLLQQLVLAGYVQQVGASYRRCWQ